MNCTPEVGHTSKLWGVFHGEVRCEVQAGSGTEISGGRQCDRRRPTKAARLQQENGEVIMELVDVQVDAIKASRMVIKGIERRQTEGGVLICIEN